MLITCPECGLMLSDKASVCPHCGFEARKPSRRLSKKPHRRLPNGFGQITEIKGRFLRKPYRAMVSVGKKPNGRPDCKVLAYFETYNEAYAALVEYNRNPYDLDKAITVKELYEKWSSQTDLSRNITSVWPYCEQVYDMKAQDIRVRHIKACMEVPEAPTAKVGIKSLFNRMLDYALEYEIVTKNYARDFSVETPETQTEHVAYTHEEVDKLWQNTSIPLMNAILLQCYTGFRPQELCKIRKEDVNINERYIVGGMKTEAGKERIVPICDKAMPLVKKLLYMSDVLGSDMFIVDNNGKPMTYNKYYHKFENIMKEVGIEGHKPHDPRKTFVTMCKECKVDEYAIKRIVGHKIEDITEKIYTERKLDWLLEEVKKIEDW